MFSDKLSSLLKALSVADLQRFGKFVDSPFFNENETLSKLSGYLIGMRLNNELAFNELSKEQIWKAIFAEGAYQDNQLRKLFFELNQLLYQYLAVSAQMHDPFAETFQALRVVERLSLPKHETGLNRKLHQMMEEREVWQADDFLAAHRFTFDSLDQAGPSTDFLPLLFDSKKYLEVFYLVRALQIAMRMKAYSLSRNNQAQVLPFMDFEQTIHSGNYLSYPIVQVYYAAFLIFEHAEDEALYFDFSNQLKQHEDKIHTADLYDLYQHAINYCAKRINRGDLKYYRELFDLLKNMTTNDLILAKGELAEGIYKNVITTGLAVKEYAWVEQFIHEKSRFLPERIRDNAMSFNLASVYFSQKKYGEVISLLQKVEYSDVVYNLGARWLLIRTYYEMDAIKALDSLLDSFRIYLLRNKVLSKGIQKEYLSLISFTRRLLKSKYEKDKLAALKAKVLGTQIQIPKRWIIEKIEELEKK